MSDSKACAQNHDRSPASLHYGAVTSDGITKYHTAQEFCMKKKNQTLVKLFLDLYAKRNNKEIISNMLMPSKNIWSHLYVVACAHMLFKQ